MKRLYWSSLASAAVILSGLLLSGCRENYKIREYPAPRETEEVITSEALRGQFPTIPFEWQVPDSWQTAELDQFSTVAWQTGPVAQEARITLSKLSTAAGVLQQVIRWRGQLQLETTTEADLTNSYQERSLDGVPATYVDISNQTETILGLIVPIEDNMWIFKYRAPNTTAKTTGESFRKFVSDLEIVESAKSDGSDAQKG